MHDYSKDILSESMVVASIHVGAHPTPTVSCSDLDTLPSTIAGIKSQAMATLLLTRQLEHIVQWRKKDILSSMQILTQHKKHFKTAKTCKHASV